MVIDDNEIKDYISKKYHAKEVYSIDDLIDSLESLGYVVIKEEE